MDISWNTRQTRWWYSHGTAITLPPFSTPTNTKVWRGAQGRSSSSLTSACWVARQENARAGPQTWTASARDSASAMVLTLTEPLQAKMHRADMSLRGWQLTHRSCACSLPRLCSRHCSGSLSQAAVQQAVNEVSSRLGGLRSGRGSPMEIFRRPQPSSMRQLSKGRMWS